MMWMKEKGFEDVVKGAWKYNVDEQSSVKEKLKRCAISLKNWEKVVFGSVRTQLKECKEELALLLCINPSDQQS
ncbi:unnamed protein product [Prunus armeniaca]|uniref:Uncharacterized protein n=1 Tax=Prunus armeniaca TaxID=36596 RepID=A0A6J5VY70_PRUAR|nr:unnamed protein product [Prunus armeniaca]CAB4294199.1 unnamed protein product [Prunus armeniaca]